MGKRIFMISLFIVGLVACSTQESTVEKINRAEKLTKAAEYDEALKIYQTVKATEELPDTLDAMVSFSLADIYLNHKNQYRKAIEYYREVAEEYSDTQWGAKSQFLLGYVNANHLRNYDIAEEEYQVFLDLYPTHELTTAVEFELNHLGADPTELDSLDFLQSAAQQ